MKAKTMQFLFFCSILCPVIYSELSLALGKSNKFNHVTDDRYGQRGKKLTMYLD